jgi:hypothetical protein
LLGRVRVPTVPRRLRSYSALRLPRSPWSRLWACPSSRGLPGCGRFFCAGRALSRSAHGASEILLIALAPRRPDNPRRNEGLPGYWAVLFDRAAVQDPARRAPYHAQSPPGALPPSRSGYLSAPGTSAISGQPSAAQSLARLRIAAPVTERRRKARYRPAGLGFGRAGFAPAGRLTEFREFRFLTPL